MKHVKIGWGRREISTADPIAIPGQMHLRISEGIHDSMYATALVVDGGEGQDAVIFCSCDILVLRNGELPQIRKRLRELRPELPADALIMNATHTHSGGQTADTPETAPAGMPIYPGSKYREFFISQCLEAILEAWDTRKEGGIGYGYGYAVVGHSRRVVYFDDVSLRQPNPVAPNGHGVMYGNTNDEQFSSYEAGADHFLNLMFTFDRDQKLTGMVVNVPCPSQLSEKFKVLSSDYWADVRERVAKEFGSDVYVLTQCAAAGDLSPRILHYLKAQERRFGLKYGVAEHPLTAPAGKETPHDYNKIMCERWDIAERIVNGIKEVYSWAKHDIQTEIPVRHEFRKLRLSRRIITEEEKKWSEDVVETLRQRIPDKNTGTPEEIREAKSFYESVRNRNMRPLRCYEEQKTNPFYDTGSHAVQIGDIGFVTCQFELYMDYMHRIQARSPFVQTFVVELSGVEGSSYLATERGAFNKGYSASLLCNQVSPKGGQELVEAALAMLNNLKNN